MEVEEEEEEEEFDFEKERKLILEDVLASVMKIKIKHSVPNEALDAMKDVSAKSNLIFKKKLKEAIYSQIREQEIVQKLCWEFSEYLISGFFHQNPPVAVVLSGSEFLRF